MGDWYSDHLVGSKRYNYRGGRIKRYGPNWYSQAVHARKRDDFRCVICDASQDDVGRRLDVHHIIPFRAFGYVAGENDFYRDANELSNLITLCPGCHREAEAGNVSIAQLRSLISH